MTLGRIALGRLPIRVRLALLFCAIMAVVLLATGAFLHWRLESTLDGAMDEVLENRFEELATVVSSAEETIPDDEKTLLGEEGETVVQILSSDGEVLYQSGGVSQPLLSPEKRNRRPKDIPSPIEEYIPETDNTFRLLAGGVSTPGETVTLIVGRSTESRREALENLVAQLALGGPLVLVISSILAYVLAAEGELGDEVVKCFPAALSGAADNERDRFARGRNPAGEKPECIIGLRNVFFYRGRDVFGPTVSFLRRE